MQTKLIFLFAEVFKVTHDGVVACRLRSLRNKFKQLIF